MSHLCLFVTLVIIVTSDYLALRQNVINNPEADLPRLVLADYLEETSVKLNILSANFIRDHIQVWHDKKQLSSKKTLIKHLDSRYGYHYNNYQQLSDINDLRMNYYGFKGKLINHYYLNAMCRETKNLDNYYKYRCGVARLTRGFISSVDFNDMVYSGYSNNRGKMYNILATELNKHPIEEIKLHTRHGGWETIKVERWGYVRDNEWRLVHRELNQIKSMSGVAKRDEVFNGLHDFVKTLGWI